MENISPALLEWFYKNRRSLPFREDPTPYHVWLSEVMLQQTRVSAVLPYYYRFLEELPDIPALAACGEEKLHKLWEGWAITAGCATCKRPQSSSVRSTAGSCPPTMPPCVRCPASGSTPPEPSRPSASDFPCPPWTAMCCGCFPACIMTPALLQNRR